MQTAIAEQTAHALTEIKALTTKATPSNTQLPGVEALADHFKFELFGDPELIKLVGGAKDLLDAVHLKQPPRWLTLLGKSGVGKTYLAKAIKPLIESMLRKQAREYAPIEVAFYDWPTVVDRLRDGEYYLVQELVDLDVLILDEIGAEASTPFVFEKLCRIFNGRLGKWTIFTGNITAKALADSDARLASRIYRDKNVVVVVDTKDFVFREKRQITNQAPSGDTNR